MITCLLPSKQYCTFGVPKCDISEMCPLLDPFFDHLFASFKAILHFSGSKYGPTTIIQNCPKERDERRTNDERTDAHRIFEALLHKSPFGAIKPGGQGCPFRAFCMEEPKRHAAQKYVANRPNPGLPRTDSIRAFLDFLHLR